MMATAAAETSQHWTIAVFAACMAWMQQAAVFNSPTALTVCSQNILELWWSKAIPVALSTEVQAVVPT